MPSRPAGGAGPDPPVRVRVPPRRHAGPSGRLRSAPPGCSAAPPQPPASFVRTAGRPGDERRALRRRGPGVLDRRQRPLPSSAARGHPDARHLADRPAGAPTGPRQLAGPDGDPLLHRPAQGDQATGLRRPGGPGRAAADLPGALQRHRRTLRLALRPHVPRPPASTARRPPTPSRMAPDDSTESSTRTRSPSRPITWSIGEGCAGRPKASTGWGPHPADRARAAGHQRGSRPSAGGGTGALPLCPAGDRRGMRSRSAA